MSRNVFTNSYTSLIKNEINGGIYQPYSNVLFLENLDKRVFSISPWIKYDSLNFDRVNVKCDFVDQDLKIFSSSDFTMDLYQVDDSGFGETFLLSKTFISTVDVLESEISPVSFYGEFTFRALFSCTRLGKTYVKELYFNHLGTYFTLFQLRNRVEFLEITKEDE